MRKKICMEISEKGFFLEDDASAFSIGMMKKEDFPDWKHKGGYKILISIHSENGLYCFNATKKFFREMKRQLFYFEKIHLEGRHELIHEDIMAGDIEWSLKGEKIKKR